MSFFKFVNEHQLLAFVLLNFILIDAVQAISVARKGFGQIVSLAGYYGDRALVFLILLVSYTLTKHGFQFGLSSFAGSVGVVIIYAISVLVAQKYLPPPTVEDVYHNFVALPIFSIILIFGLVPALYCGSGLERAGMLALIGTWLVLLSVDIKTDRLDQAKFMTARKLPV